MNTFSKNFILKIVNYVMLTARCGYGNKSKIRVREGFRLRQSISSVIMVNVMFKVEIYCLSFD